jgi:hypothetical protein
LNNFVNLPFQSICRRLGSRHLRLLALAPASAAVHSILGIRQNHLLAGNPLQTPEPNRNNRQQQQTLLTRPPDRCRLHPEFRLLYSVFLPFFTFFRFFSTLM